MTLYARLVAPLNRIPSDLLLLVARLGIGAVFWMSGRTKVDGLLHITDSTYSLFESEYAGVPLPPHLAAHLATYSEHLFPILLVLGLFTRVGALGLIGMTATIEIFVYPEAWPTHLNWLAILLPLLARGGGAWTLDALLGIERPRDLASAPQPGYA